MGTDSPTLQAATATSSVRASVCFAEGLGTFALVFAGTGAIVINDISGGSITHVGVALTFGLIVMVMVYAVGNISGCHINPAVTIGFFLSNRFKAKGLLPYIGSQLAGACLASGCILFLFPGHQTLGATLPAGGIAQAFLLEVVLTWILMFVILAVTSLPTPNHTLAGLAIGGTVALDALFGGPITGASMNPARSIGPALLSGNLTHLWIYIFAPIIGATVAVMCHRGIADAIPKND